MLKDDFSSELTRQEEEDQPVHHQHRPKNGNVEEGEPCADEGDSDGAGGRVPELEFGKPSDEWAELVVLLRRQCRLTVLQPFVLSEGGVELGLQEGEE